MKRNSDGNVVLTK
ncbi:hypothetical protein RDI58_001613 [Solanum bulbocastanum]|uniref:Uncharacterized protein n=1 Tax=Solanum bulbocastanum TaxID=147425 RepID=A0AAN8U5E7_SOLBU